MECILQPHGHDARHSSLMEGTGSCLGVARGDEHELGWTVRRHELGKLVDVDLLPETMEPLKQEGVAFALRAYISTSASARRGGMCLTKSHSMRLRRAHMAREV